MAEEIIYNGISGRFLPASEWEELCKRVRELEKELEIVRGVSKYKLKKLAQIIERKDKQLSQLKTRVQEA